MKNKRLNKVNNFIRDHRDDENNYPYIIEKILCALNGYSKYYIIIRRINESGY
jgi:hypothetical protein